MQNREINMIIVGLTQLAEKQEKEKITIPIKVAYAINKNKNLLMKEQKENYAETLSKLVEKYNVKVNEDGRFNVEGLDAEVVKNFSIELNELLDIDVNVDIHFIKLEDLGNFEPTLKDLETLNFMIAEDKTEE